MRVDLPLCALVGQDELKLALMLVAVDPTIGGVLISGERGTAKSTAARGLATLLPQIAAGRPAPFVELPLGATEDRLVGSLDLAKVLHEGRPDLRSGLLARADGGILYVDEVNLLPDHLVDLLLDAAASGWIRVERDGLSAVEAARFVLIGTMNPEEGELRPQFRDRFGLCVRVRGLDVPDERIAAIRQRLAFDDQPARVLESVRHAQDALRQRILAARERLASLPITDALFQQVAALSIEHGLDGIRGDLAILKAARALAAWQAETAIDAEHIRRAADFAIPHRAKRKRKPPATGSPAPIGGPAPTRKAPSQADETGEGVADTSSQLQPSPPEAGPALLELKTAGVMDADHAGKRANDSMAAQRVIGTRAFAGTGTLAITQTLVAAAARGARVGHLGITLEASDLKQHERRGPGRSHVLFLVDASGSMATQRRLQVAKGAALSLLKSSYQRRDEVGLMVFRGDATDLALPFTRQIASIEKALEAVPTGGRTPLARALVDATSVLQTKKPALLVLFTDGRANVSLSGGDPWEDALAACARTRAACTGALVVDCESGPVTLGRARVLSEALGGDCIELDSLDSQVLTLRIHERLEIL